MKALLFVFLLIAALPVALLAVSTAKERRGVKVSFQDVDFSSSEDEGNARLIQTQEDKPAKWMFPREILGLFRQGIKYMDITDYQDLGKTVKARKIRQFPVKPQFEDEVIPFIEKLNIDNMKKNLKNFTSFRNRYYRSKSGERSSKWLYKQVLKIVKSADEDVNVSVRKYKHSWNQRSVIARFEGTESSGEEVVIIGAHQDSINMWFPSFGSAPGADDDGSGSVTILEAFRTLVDGGFKPNRPVEFHWYSAEEAGLLGSQDIARHYEKEEKDVIAMLQNDMTGYIGRNGETIGIVTDHVDTKLTDFVTTLVEAYAKIPWISTKCGYACSDHASWRKAGFPSAFAIEGDFGDTNPNIHTSYDTIDKLSFEHMLEFAKLSISFAVELSHVD